VKPNIPRGGSSPVFVNTQFLCVLSFIVNRAAITKRGMQLHTVVIGDVGAEQTGQLLLACNDAAISNPHPNGPKVLAVPRLWGSVGLEMQLERDAKECGEEEAQVGSTPLRFGVGHLRKANAHCP